ncbi:MAG: ABC transporter permease subunit [Hyphomonadaceae bacterium]|nr:ABC transporter permease subunit [Hyphomonadaceae bacterium]
MMSQWQGTLTGLRAAWRREISAYFATPLAYVFVAIFLLVLGVFTWDLSRFFDTGAADLGPFFYWHPWLFMMFMPALAMRLWSEETSQGTAELLLALPVSLPGLVIGKLLAAWTVAALALALTVPWWIAVNILGPADNAAIAVTYMMSLIMAGAYLAIGAAVSALTRSAVLAFVIGVLVAFILTAAGWPLVSGAVADLLGPSAGDAIAQFSFLTHFETAQRGVLELRGLIFFFGFIALCVALNTLFVSHRRGGAQ